MATRRNDVPLEVLLGKYNVPPERGSYEFEIRLKLPRTGIIELFDKAEERFQPRFAQTIVALSSLPQPLWLPKDSDFVHEIHFAGPKSTKREYRWKSTIGTAYNQTVPYKAALSLEAPADQQSSQKATVRIKARASFDWNADWRLDVTAVRTVRNASDVESAKNALFPKEIANSQDYKSMYLSSRARGEEALVLEAEIEYVGNPPIDPAGLRKTIAEIVALSTANEGYHARDRMAYAARLMGRPRAIQERCQNGTFPMKNLLPAAHTLTRTGYREIFPPKGYFISPKADGVRALACVQGGLGWILWGKTINFSKIHDYGPTLVDGEYVESPPAFYAFDVLYLKGVSCLNKDTGARFEMLAPAVEVLTQAGIPAHLKEFAQVWGDDIEATARRMLDQTDFLADGLIFTPPGTEYEKTIGLKWKPQEKNTIDFYARRAPEGGSPPLTPHRREVPGQGDGPSAKTLYYLFVGIDPYLYESTGLQPCPGYEELFGAPTGQYFPIQFSPAGTPLAYLFEHADGSLDGKIVELTCQGDCSEGLGGDGRVNWTLVSVREDRAKDIETGRYFGNFFKVAESVWLNVIDPFPAEMLWQGPGGEYFQSVKDSTYAAQTAFTSFVKAQLIQQLANKPWVVDFGAGKGQDLGRYFAAKVKNLVAVDKDRAALAELVRRRYTHLEMLRKRGDTGIRTALHVMIEDLTNPHHDTLERFIHAGLHPGEADAVVCNLTLHYLLNTAETMRNFIVLINSLLRPGGKAFFTILRGEAVHDTFQTNATKPGDVWKLTEESTLKYAFKRMYPDDTMSPAGQKIGVLLPFSMGNYYEENLVNLGFFLEECISRGFKVAETRTFSDYEPAFAKENAKMNARLSDNDRAFLRHYGTFSIERGA